MEEHGIEHEKFLEEFLDICKKHLNDQQILALVKQTYKKTNPNFLATCEFQDKVQITGAKIESNPSRIYIFIKELIEELKPYKIKKVKKRKREEENSSKHVAKKSRTLLLTATVELNAHEKFSNRYRDDSQDEDSGESGEGGSVVTTVADVHPLGLTKPHFRLSSAVESFSSPVINSKKVNHSSPSNCSIHLDDSIDNLDLMPEKSQPGSRLRMRRIILQPVMDNGDDSESTQPSKTSLASPELSEKDEAWNPVENDYESGASADSATKCKKISKTVDVSLENVCSSTAQDASVSESDAPTKKVRGRASERQIQRLEKLLYSMDKEIKRLGEKEIALDDLDDDDSAYLRCERLKARCNKVFNKLCELKDKERLTGRAIEKRFAYEGTRYPEINKGIRKFVNKNKVFPDYRDVHAIIVRANRRHKLQLKKSAIDSLCREAFTDVGNQLQQRRHKDFVSDFGCHLTDNDRSIADPAIFDKNLRRKLEENQKRGRSKMEEVMEKYARKQFDLQNGNLEDTDDTDNDSDSDAVEDMFDEEEKLEEEEQEIELEEVMNESPIQKASDSEDDLPVFGQKKPKPVMMIISDDESEPERSPDIQSIYSSGSEEMEEDGKEVGKPGKMVDHKEIGDPVADEISVDDGDLRIVGIIRRPVETWNVENSVNGVITGNLENVLEPGNIENTAENGAVGDSQVFPGLQVVGVMGNVQGMWGSQEMNKLGESQKNIDVNKKSVDRTGSEKSKKIGEFDINEIVPNMLKVNKVDSAKIIPEKMLKMGEVEIKGCSEQISDFLSLSKRVGFKANDPVGDSNALQNCNNLGESQKTDDRRTSLKIGTSGQKKLENIMKSLQHGTSASPVAKISEPVEKPDSGTCCLKGGEETPNLLKVAGDVASPNGGVENDTSKAALEVCTISDNESEPDLGWDFNPASDSDGSLVELSDGDSEPGRHMNPAGPATCVSFNTKRTIKSSPTSSPNEKIPNIDQFDIISTPVKKTTMCFDSAKLKLKCSPGFVKRTRNLIEQTNNSYVSLTDSEDEASSVKSGDIGEKAPENHPVPEYIYIE